MEHYDDHHAGCGGTILVANSGTPDAYEHCDRCGAFQYGDIDEPFPTCTDKAANQQAWDDGQNRSPDGEEETP